MLTLALILLCAGLSSSRNLIKGKFFITKVFFFKFYNFVNHYTNMYYIYYVII